MSRSVSSSLMSAVSLELNSGSFFLILCASSLQSVRRRKELPVRSRMLRKAGSPSKKARSA